MNATVMQDADATEQEANGWRWMAKLDPLRFARISPWQVLHTLMKAISTIRRQRVEIGRLHKRLGKYEKKIADNWPDAWTSD